MNRIMAIGKKTGGRKKGTPNKDNPLKGKIRTHSEDYFERKPRKDPETGEEYEASDFDMDMALLSPADRVSAELKLLKFHMPEMKAVEMDMTVSDVPESLEEKLARLAGEG